MAYIFTDEEIGLQPIATAETTAQHPLGYLRKAKDPTYGEGEFIYLKAGTACTVGQVVNWDSSFSSAPIATTGRGGMAFAMGTVALNSYGWYQISGIAVAKSGTVAATALVYLTAVAGTIDDAVSATNKLEGALTRSADGTPSAGFCLVQCSRPSANGNG